MCDWIGFRATMAKPLDIQGIQTLASAVSGKKPGKNWVGQYMKRQPEVCQSRPGSLDPKRAQNFNPSNVAGFYDLLKAIYDVYPDLPAQHIWNMDEKGLQLGGGRKRSKKYFHLKSLKRSKFYRIRSDNLELVTIIECISPACLSIPPAFVLAQGPIPALPDLGVDIGAVATSPNGWTDNELGLEWFKQTFIPFATTHKLNDDPILLLLDGHDSHETDKLRTLAYEHDIFILAFPSKCTHKLQPLDVTVFSQVQRKWSAHCDHRIYENVAINRYNVIPEYMQVRVVSMTPELISSAFSCTGIYPFNPQVFANVDFAPAKMFSTTSHVPTSFPADVPSSSPIASDASNSASLGDGEPEDESDIEMDITAPHPLYLDWDTDSDGPEYEPPPSLLSASPLSRGPPVASAISLPSLISPPMLATPTGTVSEHAFSPHSTEPPERSDGLPINMDASASGHSLPRYITRSHNGASSSAALSISIALDPEQAPQPRSVEELAGDNNRLRMTNSLLEKELVQARAMLVASNAHCTIMRRAEEGVRAELLSKKNKTRRTVKTSARYVAHTTMKEIHASQAQEKAKREKEVAEKEVQKAEEEAAREVRIREEINTRIFQGA